MTARFELDGEHETVVVLEPERGIEAFLLAAFIRYDSNAFSVSVERAEDGQIRRLILSASPAS